MEENKEKFKAKQLSKWSMIAAAIWVIAMSILRAIFGMFTEIPFGLTVDEILKIGGTIAVIFGGVGLNILADKFTKKE